MVNVYTVDAERPVNVYAVPDVVCVVVAGVVTSWYPTALEPAVHESEIVGLPVELVCWIDETGPAGGDEIYEMVVV